MRLPGRQGVASGATYANVWRTVPHINRFGGPSVICIMHGYLLEGSGSNLWTRSIVHALCRDGQDVHLVCQEAHPKIYDFIAAAYVWIGIHGIFCLVGARIFRVDVHTAAIASAA